LLLLTNKQSGDGGYSGDIINILLWYNYFL